MSVPTRGSITPRDGGRHWHLQFQNEDPNGFYDCFAFWDRDRGITMGDAVAGRFPVLRTRDGEHWRDIGDNLPAAQAGEARLCRQRHLRRRGRRPQRPGSAPAPPRRRGSSPPPMGAAPGTATTLHRAGQRQLRGDPLAFRDRYHGILAGGDLALPDSFTNNVARSRDGGQTWELGASPPFPGSVYGLSYTGKYERSVLPPVPAAQPGLPTRSLVGWRSTAR